MRKELLFFSGMTIAGLGLSACNSPDITDAMVLRCQGNPQSKIQEQLELRTGQTIYLNQLGIEVIGPGRLRFVKTVITQDDAVLYGNTDRMFQVKGAAGEEDRTVITITLNCADPKNP